MLRKSEKPLSQLNNRIHERIIKCTTNYNSSSTYDKPLLIKPDGRRFPLQCQDTNNQLCRPYKKIKFKDFTLTTKSPNNCCYLKDGSIFSINYLGLKDEYPIVLGTKYLNIRPIPMYPCNSQNMKIYITNSKTLDLETISAREIDNKGLEVFYNGYNYIMPLLHI